jgi:hypothetical protein
MQNNGKSGIWQGGVGLAVDTTHNQVFFAVGYFLLSFPHPSPTSVVAGNI